MVTVLTLEAKIMLARINRMVIPKIGRIHLCLAWCSYCAEVFEWIPEHVNSTKRRYNSDGIYPRCPYCKRYKTTIDKGETQGS